MAKKSLPTPKSPVATSTVDTLAAVLKLFGNSGLHELEFEDSSVHVRLTRNPSGATTTTVLAAPPMPAARAGVEAYAAPPAAPPTQPAAAPHTHVPATHTTAPEGEQGGHLIQSPFVGTFYRSPNPTAAPFVQVGSPVKKGQTLCIIEAMKLMNEIEADEDGKVIEIFVENAQPVEFGQKLFRIVPA